MIGSRLYEKKSKVVFFLAMYGVLALIGVALIGLSLSRNENPSGAEGFTLIFGAGMAYLTWSKSRKPRVIVREEYIELHQQNRPEFIKYKGINTVTRTRDHRLIIGSREGHDLKNTSILLKYLEEAEAERLADFCQKKGWKKGI